VDLSSFQAVNWLAARSFYWKESYGFRLGAKKQNLPPKKKKKKKRKPRPHDLEALQVKVLGKVFVQ
jgi:hypothetical protein